MRRIIDSEDPQLLLLVSKHLGGQLISADDIRAAARAVNASLSVLPIETKFGAGLQEAWRVADKIGAARMAKVLAANSVPATEQSGRASLQVLGVLIVVMVLWIILSGTVSSSDQDLFHVDKEHGGNQKKSKTYETNTMPRK